eukprot:COSAG05_NODE_16_length_35726_cov_813.577584_7_plen_35_part_00
MTGLEKRAVHDGNTGKMQSVCYIALLSTVHVITQ